MGYTCRPMATLSHTGAPVRVVWTRRLSAEDAADYDRFVDTATSGSYAQARSLVDVMTAGRHFAPRWFLARAGDDVIGAGLVLRPRAVGPLVLPAAVLERGPVCRSLADLPVVLSALRRAALRRGVARLQVMPYFAGADADRAEDALARAGYKCVHEPSSAHARTLRIDLAGKDELGLFPSKSLRRDIKQAERLGARARRGTAADLSVLASLYASLMRAQGKTPKTDAYFAALSPVIAEGKRAALFVCEHEGTPMSAMLVMRHGTQATWLLGASNMEKRPFSKTGPTMACAIRWAQAEGCTVFDLGGIPMEGDHDEKRRSIAAFKFDFSKTEVRLVREHARWG